MCECCRLRRAQAGLSRTPRQCQMPLGQALPALQLPLSRDMSGSRLLETHRESVGPPEARRVPAGGWDLGSTVTTFVDPLPLMPPVVGGAAVDLSSWPAWLPGGLLLWTLERLPSGPALGPAHPGPPTPTSSAPSTPSPGEQRVGVMLGSGVLFRVTEVVGKSGNVMVAQLSVLEISDLYALNDELGLSV